MIEGNQVTFVWQGKSAPRLIDDMHGWEEGPQKLESVAPELWAYSISNKSPHKWRLLRTKNKNVLAMTHKLLRFKNIYKSPITHIIDLVDKKYRQQNFKEKGMVIL